nr:MAG TPA: hypothetical protein [Bacteriophage sp.]
MTIFKIRFGFRSNRTLKIEKFSHKIIMRRFKYPRHMQFCIQKSVKNFS